VNKKYQQKIRTLTELEFEVTQNKGTEPAFANSYWDNKNEGIYVDIITGEPLFSSLDKYDSGCGWPSFSKTIDEAEIILKDDLSHGLVRTEALTETTHLGHLFNDGPKDQGGMRYCINSSAIKFIAKEQLLESGYGDFLALFSGKQPEDKEYAYLAGGCFWGLEYLLGKQGGIISTSVGYTGGMKPNPRYEEVSTGKSGYAETVQLCFSPRKISYRKLLKLFFSIHDPTSKNSQGNDIGTQYRSAIFYASEVQKFIALSVIENGNISGVFPGNIVTEVVEITNFYTAEEYHQKYLVHNPDGYSCHFERKNWKF